MMKGNIINPAHLEYYLTDEEIYTMTLKKYFKFASGVGDNLITADEFKYWLVNQMKVQFTEQDFEVFFQTTMQGKNITEDDFISLCMNGLHSYDVDTVDFEKQL